MPPVLRKRKAPEAPPPPPPAAKKATKAAPKAKAGVVKPAAAKEAAPKTAAKEEPAEPATKPVVGDVIALEGFGGEIETNDGNKVTLKGLVDESKGGVVLFTYPKASTPGCTKQVCSFRDNYDDLTKTGLAIYGLSTDSGKANTTFRTNQKLPYPLLCDPAATLIAAIGLKKSPKGTQRGVFVVNKEGKVLAAQAGSPDGTVAVVKALVERADEGSDDKAAGSKENGKKEEEEGEKE
ncbi:related to DOT5 - involved in derepression of telomeric silencing [Cephalotrichum gorgonifer]|uniref:thioredoxin-dependent peroxiredoxin n=1 Tax=Cephalotrichum gorgonifer TaxID=2041049 RepID=A0AAE8MR94_9PEZI|nr:related to DOT5 - involved in derepression of telomeric silencing [Cephalotrichum gorgonifer]